MDGFINLRYPYIQETEPFVFADEDFQGTRITRFPATYNFYYQHCNFRDATLGAGDGSMWTEANTSESDTATGLGLTFVTFVECDMRDIDLSQTRASACRFYKCNLSGAKWGKHTHLGWPDRAMSCLFDKVVLDSDFLHFLEKQGVKFANIDQAVLLHDYDVSQNYIFESNDSSELNELHACFPG